MAVVFAALIGLLCHVVLGQQEDILKTTPGTTPLVPQSGNQCLQVNCGSPRPTSCVGVKGPETRKIIVTVAGNELLCDTKTENGSWTVIQRRYDGSEDFYRGWGHYKYGFGSPKSEFWLGLELLHKLTTKQCHELRIDMKYNGKEYFAKYSYVKVSGEDDKYRLELGNFSGNVRDSLSSHNNKQFTTNDKDNDELEENNCAELYNGAFWYAGCLKSNLNGLWGNKQYGKGVIWESLTRYYDSLSFTEMKIRPCYD